MLVMGTPAPQGSKVGYARGGRVQIVESSKRVTPWREAVVAQCQREGVAGLMLPGPVVVEVSFFFARPRSHFGTGRNATVVKPNAPRRPMSRNDIDKLCRSTLDGITQAGWIADDQQVVSLYADKRWCGDRFPVPCACIEVTPL